MVSELGYLTSAKLRVDAALDSDDDDNWTNSDLDTIITASEHMAHILGKRPTTNPWTNAEDVYEVVQRFVSADARYKMFSSMDDYEAEHKQAKEERTELIPLLKEPEQGGDGYGAKSAGANNDKTQSDSTTGAFT